MYGGLGGGSLSGNLLVAGAAVCWGSYTAFSIFMLRKYSPLTVASTMLVAGLAMVPFASRTSCDWTGRGVGVSVGGHRVLHSSSPHSRSRPGRRGSAASGRIRCSSTSAPHHADRRRLRRPTLGGSLGTSQLIGAAIIFCSVYLGRRQ